MSVRTSAASVSRPDRLGALLLVVAEVLLDAADERGAVAGRLRERREVRVGVRRGARRLEVRADKLAVADDRREQVVEVVRDAHRHAAEHLEAPPARLLGRPRGRLARAPRRRSSRGSGRTRRLASGPAGSGAGPALAARRARRRARRGRPGARPARRAPPPRRSRWRSARRREAGGPRARPCRTRRATRRWRRGARRRRSRGP